MKEKKKKKRVLLLAPPGDKVYLRDLYCSSTPKAAYYWPPSDLIIQSGILRHDFELHVIDAIAERMSYTECTKNIVVLKPDAIISLSSSISLTRDIPFLRTIKEKTSCILIMSGDIFYFEPMLTIQKFKFIDAIMLNYTTNDTLKYLKNDFKNLKNFCYRKGDDIVLTGKETKKHYTYQTPLLDSFPSNKYSMPYMRRKPLGCVNTNYGCPSKCTFCSQCLIPFASRDIENVIDELKYLESKGIKELVVKDYTFNIGTERTKNILRRMIEEHFNFTWTCFMRANNVDEEMVRLLKKSGCHTIMFGVESGNDNVLDDIRKGITKKETREAFDICHKLKVRTLAHFILGFPQDTPQTVNETIEFSKEIKCTFAAFNLYVPRVGSEERKKVIGRGIDDDVSKLDSSGKNVESYTKHITTDTLINFRRQAIAGFYLSPIRIFNIIKAIRTPYEALTMFKNFATMVRKY
jgi:uncharacterized radical SAM superfamily protein